MRKSLAILFASLCCFTFFLQGCSEKKTQIACFVYDQNDTFLSELLSVMEEKAKEQYSLKKHFAQNSQSVQNNQIVTAIENGTGLLFVNLVDRTSSGAIIEKTKRNNLSTVFFNREPLSADMKKVDNAFYVGADPLGAGVLQARIAADAVGENYRDSGFDSNGDGMMQLLVFKGERGHQDAEMRTTGCIDEIGKLYDTDVLAIETANWSKSEAKKKMQQIYEAIGAQAEVIFCNNDDMALGVIEYLTERGIFKESKEGYHQPKLIVGVDGTAVGREAIRNGLLYGTVLNDAQKQTDAMLCLADYILKKKDLKDFPYTLTDGKYIYVEGQIILRQNA